MKLIMINKILLQSISCRNRKNDLTNSFVIYCIDKLNKEHS